MPCSGGQWDDYVDAPSRQTFEKLKSEFDEVTRLLCTILRTNNIKDPEVQEWYKKHERWDKSQGR